MGGLPRLVLASVHSRQVISSLHLYGGLKKPAFIRWLILNSVRGRFDFLQTEQVANSGDFPGFFLQWHVTGLSWFSRSILPVVSILPWL